MNDNTLDAASTTWESLKLSKDLLDLVDKAGFKHPTPIQVKAIPPALTGKDLIASAQTGSGKTVCFCFPLIEKLAGRKGTYGLILAPTREIALQTQETLQTFGKPLGITSICLIGGVPLVNDESAIKSGPHIIVGTPGRICDHLERGNLWLEYVEMLVLDEADRMLDMGFARELNRITDELKNKKQTLLFSATMPPPIEKFAQKTLRDPVRIQIGKALTSNRDVDQLALIVREQDKTRALMKLLKREKGTVIVFNCTKDGTYKLWRTSLDHGINDATYISSNKRQSDREKALEGFKSGEFRILFATDVAGRGIHVEGVGHVINYDLPKEAEDYIHRIGRTGRKGTRGHATSLVTTRETRTLKRIESILGHAIPKQDISGGGTSESGRSAPSRGRTTSARRSSTPRQSRAARKPAGRSPQSRSSRTGHSRREDSRDERSSRSDRPRRSESRRSEPRRSDSRRSEPRRSESRRSEPRRSDSRRSEPRRSESRRSEPRRSDSRRTEPRRSESRRSDSRRSEPRRDERPRRSEPRREERSSSRRSEGRRDGRRTEPKQRRTKPKGRGRSRTEESRPRRSTKSKTQSPVRRTEPKPDPFLSQPEPGETELKGTRRAAYPGQRSASVPSKRHSRTRHKKPAK